MRIYLVRHGESVAQERTDWYQQAMQPIGLTQLGQLQAQEAGRQFAAWLHGRPDQLQVYSSPYLRARQTRDIFMQQGDLDACARKPDDLMDDRIGEREQGDFAGINPKDYGKIRRGEKKLQCGETVRPYDPAIDESYMQLREQGNTYDAKPPNGECGKELCDRIRSFIAEKQLRTPDRDVIVFAHSNVIDAFISILSTRDEAGCRACYNHIMRDPNNITGNACVVMLEDSKGTGVFDVTRLPQIKPPKTMDGGALQTRPHPAAERHYLHLTDFKGDSRTRPWQQRVEEPAAAASSARPAPQR